MSNNKPITSLEALRKAGITNFDHLNPQDKPKQEVVTEDNLGRVLSTLMLAVVGSIPEVGSLVSGVLSLFVPDFGTPSLTWDKIEKNVAALTQSMIDQERAKTLRSRATGLMQVAQLYIEERDGNGSQKNASQFFTSLLSLLTASQDEFLRVDAPQTMIGYLVYFGSLHICALKERVDRYHTIYGEPDPRADAHRKALDDAIITYTKGVKAAKEGCIAWRMDFVNISSVDIEVRNIGPLDPSVGGSARTRRAYSITVCDKKSNVEETFVWSDSSDPTHKEQIAKVFYQDLRDRVCTAYIAALDDVLLPTQAWSRMGSDKALDAAMRINGCDPLRVAPMRIVYVPELYRSVSANHLTPDLSGEGIDRPLKYTNHRSVYEKNGPISHITMYRHSTAKVVCGIQVSYGGVDTPVIGMVGNEYKHLNISKGDVLSDWMLGVAHVSRSVGAMYIYASRAADGDYTSGTRQEFEYNPDTHFLCCYHRDFNAKRCLELNQPVETMLYVTAWEAVDSDVPDQIRRLSFVAGKVYL